MKTDSYLNVTPERLPLPDECRIKQVSGEIFLEKVIVAHSGIINGTVENPSPDKAISKKERGKIDTGAVLTLIPWEMAVDMGLKEVGKVTIKDASKAGKSIPLFRVDIKIDSINFKKTLYV